MAAREYMLAILLVNGGMLLFMFWFFFDQANLPLNPTGVPNMTWDLAFHSASSFTTNTNFTHFTNESQVSFGSLDIAWQLALFLSAATGLCVMAAMVRGFVRKDGTLGNYYVDMVRSISRVLLPVSIVGAIILVVMGVPETWSATVIAHPITGGTQTIYLGPVASWQTISLVGSNGGGCTPPTWPHRWRTRRPCPTSTPSSSCCSSRSPPRSPSPRSFASGPRLGP